MQGYFQTAVVLALCALFATPAFASPSSARVTLKLNPSGEQRSFDNLSSAFHELYEQYGGVGFYGTQVLDYSTFGKKEKLVDAERAYFLVDADKAKSAGEDFKVVAFADRKAAAAAQKKLGGELRDFGDAWEAVAKHWGVDLNPKPTAPTAAPATEAHSTRRPQRQAPADCFT